MKIDLGKLEVEILGNKVKSVKFKDIFAPMRVPETEESFVKEVYAKLVDYFNGQPQDFRDIPIDYGELSANTVEVLEFLRHTVPWGSVISYKELAYKLGYKNGARRIGQAMKHNPVPILVPCHRVVGTKSLGGYTPGIRIKEYLLKLEGAI